MNKISTTHRCSMFCKKRRARKVHLVGYLYVIKTKKNPFKVAQFLFTYLEERTYVYIRKLFLVHGNTLIFNFSDLRLYKD